MAKKQSRKGKRYVPKTVSRLPDLDEAKSAVRLSFSKTVVLRYRIHLESRLLAPGMINLRLAAVAASLTRLPTAVYCKQRIRAAVNDRIGIELGNWKYSHRVGVADGSGD